MAGRKPTRAEVETAIVAGLARLAAATRAELSDAELEVYAEALVERTTPEEWDQLTRSLATRLRWFPKLVELLDALEEFRGRPALDVEAGLAYDRVLAASNYTPEGGASWSYRDVRDRCGAVAAEAFLAAGGHNAFATTWDEAKRRERFLAAYQGEARERPAGRLIGAGPGLKALPTGAAEPTKAEAARLLGEIERRARVQRDADELLGEGECPKGAA